MAKQARNVLQAVLDKKADKVKATYKTMLKVESELGGIPDSLMNAEGTNFDYDTIAKMYCWLMQQDDEEITLDEVRDSIHMGNIMEMVDIINVAYTPDVPEALRVQMEQRAAEAEPEQDETEATEKNVPEA